MSHHRHGRAWIEKQARTPQETRSTLCRRRDDLLLQSQLVEHTGNPRQAARLERAAYKIEGRRRHIRSR